MIPITYSNKYNKENIYAAKLKDKILIDGDEYEVKKIKTGGMAKILYLFSVKNNKFQKLPNKIVLKCIDPNYLEKQNLISLFEKEIKTWSILGTAGVSKCFGVGETLYNNKTKIPVAILEQYDGNLNSLTRILKIARKNFRIYSDKMRLCFEITKSLKDIYEKHGLLHLDIKPENILFKKTSFREQRNPKVTNINFAKCDRLYFNFFVTDWGISKHIKNHTFSVQDNFEKRDAEVNNTICGFGTPSYMAPERFMSQQIGIQSDIFSLGVLFAELALNKSITKNSRENTILNDQGYPLSSEEIIIEGRYLCSLSEEQRQNEYFPKKYLRNFVDLLKQMVAYNFNQRPNNYDTVLKTISDLMSYKRYVSISNKKRSINHDNLTPHPLYNKRNKQWFTKEDLNKYTNTLSLKDKSQLFSEIQEKISQKNNPFHKILINNKTRAEKYLKYITGLRENFNEIYFRYKFLKQQNNSQGAKDEFFSCVDNILYAIRQEFPLREVESTRFLPHFFLEEIQYFIVEDKNKEIFEDEEIFRVCLNLVCSIHFLVSSIVSWYSRYAKEQRVSFLEKISIQKKQYYNPLFFCETEDIYVKITNPGESDLVYACVLSTSPSDKKIFQSLFFETFYGRALENEEIVQKVRVYFQSFKKLGSLPYSGKNNGFNLVDKYLSIMNYKSGHDSVVATTEDVLSDQIIDHWKTHFFKHYDDDQELEFFEDNDEGGRF